MKTACLQKRSLGQGHKVDNFDVMWKILLQEYNYLYWSAAYNIHMWTDCGLKFLKSHNFNLGPVGCQLPLADSIVNSHLAA